ncbi:DNA topoisomerase [Terrisporobacter muris]|uniref:DNA topoisomerase n=1 Tax=Terrisporobacter muris TaxID=2963284 RepID=A0A9X2M8H8_9FIRM|nr:DNA topoisomerase [Terrisporobacter muris]MCR1821874.1 DNA topoisomerase [Terrisporobacter muris]
MKKVIIAEKPSLGMTIVQAIGGNFNKKDGYFENDKYIVTFGFGHLFQLKSIDDYMDREKTKWNIEEIPFIPSRYEFKLIDDSSVKKQFETIKKLIRRNDISHIIHCGDADREGEVIGRIIINRALEGQIKPIKRLWLPEQTNETIRKELSNLRDIEDYDLLYDEGLVRTCVDWIYGINLTRLLTCKTYKTLPVGRVLIPIVEVIHNRDMEINNFVPKKYYQGEVSFEKDNNTIKFSIDDLKFDTKEECVKAIDPLKNEKIIVRDIQIKEVKKQPKKLFSLDKLQNKLSKELKLSANDSLKIIQSLYEKGFVTYPRTNTEYLAEAEKDKVQKIIDVINKDNILEMKNKKSIFDTSKVESHSAIIPTTKIPTDLKAKELEVYNIIKNRFISNFLIEDTILEETKILFLLGNLNLSLKGTVIKSLGYLKYENDLKEKSIPKFEIGEELEPNIFASEKVTQPSKHITLEELNNYLKNPFKKSDMSEDEEYNLMLKGVEIGTVATRASIIEKAIKLGYIREEKGTFYIDKLGIDLINILKKLNIDLFKNKTVELSQTLKQVYKNEISKDRALEIFSTDLSNMINNAKKIEVNKIETSKIEKEVIGKCPRCGKNVYESEKSFYCEGYKAEPKCNFALWKNNKFFEDKGKKITKTIAKSLLSKSKVSVKGFKKKDGSGLYDADVIMSLNSDYVNFKLEFNNKK